MTLSEQTAGGWLRTRPGTSLLLQPRVRYSALVLALLLGVATPLSVMAVGNSPDSYTVRPGDTISSIAARLDVPGGWDALYAANRQTIGADPDRLRVGMQLRVPRTPPPPAVVAPDGSYAVRAGDTLSTIADELAVRGGRAALYEANRTRIGTDPDHLVVGTRLTVPGARAPLTSSVPAPSKPSSSQPPAAAPAPPPSNQAAAPPADLANDTRVAAAAARSEQQNGLAGRALVGVGAVALLTVVIAFFRRRRPALHPSAVHPSSSVVAAMARPGQHATSADDGEVRLVDPSTPLTKSSR